MRIAYIAAGAASMYCGSCIHDNTLAAALQKKGTDIALVPTYTPLRTDELNVSIDQIFYGGINVYLQQKIALFRQTPWILDRLFDRPALLNGLSRFSGSTRAEDLGALTVSVLEGETGAQNKELAKLVQWLKEDYRPDIVHLSNSMLVGMTREIKTGLGVPVLCTLQGEDIFLEGLVEPYKSRACELLRERTADVDGFTAPCQYYAGFMADYLKIPADKIHVVRLGLNLHGHGRAERHLSRTPFTVGYLARICPEKGLHLLVEAFRRLAEQADPENVRLKVAGYLGKRDEAYLEKIVQQIDAWGLTHAFDYWGEVNRTEKIDFLNRLHVLSVPTPYKEPKGRFILEALANGVPVVQPRHGAFPELIQQTGGGILVSPNAPDALAEGLLQLMNDSDYREALGRKGREAVHRGFSEDTMADATLAVYKAYFKQQA